MKKIIFLMAFAFIGSNSFADTESNFEEDLFSCCTATVTYNGEVQETFTSCNLPLNCTHAIGMACQYIQDHGGTCPNMQ